ncbi:MAG: bifunctional phosphopantothenoylcysteine decarboxylase/phosphopantothenate--cysteine ligase CoaBC [Armatimonadetes bacterium]|nr:bifunctional phosphopantothenoylcysteine decarboxylase/phosphopantothenate--cysteine ligase CoaBC [Armatimonadota bacterium]
MESVDSILGTRGDHLSGKRIVHCITGSVAAMHAPGLARELIRYGASVKVVMTPSALRFVGADLMHWASGNPVVTELTGASEHISLAGLVPPDRRSSAIVVAPVTANTVSKIASGIDDTSVTTVVSVAIGSGIPIFLAPGMHEPMYRHPILREHLERLKALGVTILSPLMIEGKAKMAGVEAILRSVVRGVQSGEWMEKRVLVTSGPTFEPLDSVRMLTNPSSGKMGSSLAREADLRGADVTLVSGPGSHCEVVGIRTIKVRTTRDMYQAVEAELSRVRYDFLFAAAAPADFTPDVPKNGKYDSRSAVSIALRPLPKIIDMVKEISPATFLVAFKAEHGLSEPELRSRASERLSECDGDLIVANDVADSGKGFGADVNEVWVLDRKGQAVHLPAAKKEALSRRILDIALERSRSLSAIQR